MPPRFDCLTCGACCAPPEAWETYVEVTALDFERLPESWRAHVREGELATCPRPGGVRCVALAGEIGARVRCVIHEQRPDACRRFERGAPECEEARRDLGVVDAHHSE